MSIQIGIGTANFANKERIVVSSTSSNLLHLRSTSSNTYMLFENSLGSNYNLGMSNNEFVINTPTGVGAAWDMYGNVNFTANATFASNLYCSNVSATNNFTVNNLNVTGLFTVGGAAFSTDVTYVSGSLGVGTTNPKAQLEVIGSGYIDNSLYSSNIYTNFISSSNALSNINLIGNVLVTSNLIVANNIISNSLTSSNLIGSNLYIGYNYLNGSNAAFINSSGFYSVGLPNGATPSAVFQYIANSSNSVNPRIVYLQSTSNMFVVDSNCCIGIGTINPQAVIHSVWSGSSNMVLLSASNVFTINNSANIGIGTTNPKYSIHLYSSNSSATSSVIQIDKYNDSSKQFLNFTSNSVSFFNVDQYGSVNVNNAQAVNPVFLPPSYSYRASGISYSPIIETNIIRAPFNYSLTSNTTFTCNLIVTLSNVSSGPFNLGPTATQCLLVYNSNIVYPFVQSNIFIATNGLVTSNIFNTIWKSPASVITSVYPGATVPAGTATSNVYTLTSNITSNVVALTTSNVLQGSSNIYGYGCSLSNFTNVQATNINASNINTNTITATNVISTNISINGFTVANNIAQITEPQFQFAGQAMWLGLLSDAQGANVGSAQQGVLKVVSYATGTFGQPTRGLTVNSSSSGTSVSLDVVTSGAGVPYIQLDNSSSYISRFYRNISYGTCIDYVNSTTYVGSLVPPFIIGDSGVVCLNNLLNISTTGVGIGLNSPSTVPSYPFQSYGSVAIGLSQSDNRGLYIISSGSVGIGTALPLNLLHVNGTIRSSGTVLQTSDRSVKTDLKKIELALDKIDKLTGYTYLRTDGTPPSLVRETGLIAQDVLAVLPEAVPEPHSAIAYGNLMGLIVEGIKELREEIREIKSYIKLNNV